MTAGGPDPDPEPFCDDPTHGETCDCGADPDYEVERRTDR
jgi:hypothetical protein